MLKGIEPLRKSEGSRAEDLVRRLETIIHERSVDESPRLGSKEELRQIFKVAQGTINEAVRVLETRGMVHLRRGPQGGVFIAPPSLTLRLSQVVLGVKGSTMSVEHCLAVRNQIEPLTLIEATKVALRKPRDVEQLYRLLDRMIETAAEPQESLRWNWLLHRRIAEMGENAVLTAIYVSLLDFIEQEVAEVAPARTYVNVDRMLSMHRDLVDAIASGDPLRAAEAAKRHPLPLDDDDAPYEEPRTTKKARAHGA